ncbi:MAG: hypothetical protein QJQ54_00845 [Mollicutes bacterium]|nr:MAG: hypothetical protein QJQ54_00845 [Mollicutes bacterium]
MKGEKFKNNKEKKEIFLLISNKISNLYNLDLFTLSLFLIYLKVIILKQTERKISGNKEKNIESKVFNYELSQTFDQKSTLMPYKFRVIAVLLAKNSFLEKEKKEGSFLFNLSEEKNKKIKKIINCFEEDGLAIFQIFLIILVGSVDQKIKADAGINYEKRVKKSLIKMGIEEEKIKKKFDINDSSTEYDFFFKINNRTFGISAKRTLRERYKQFLKTAKQIEVDVMISITIGTDVRKDIAENITKSGIFLFVSPEIYKSQKFFKDIKGVYSTKDFNKKTLLSLS